MALEGDPQLAGVSLVAVAGGGGALGKRGREGSAANAGREVVGVVGAEAGGQRDGAWVLRGRHQAGTDALGEALGTVVASGGGVRDVVQGGLQQGAHEEGSSSVGGSGGDGGGGGGGGGSPLGSLEALIVRMGRLRAASHSSGREQGPCQGVSAVGAPGPDNQATGSSTPLPLSTPDPSPPRHADPLQQRMEKQQQQVPASLPSAWSPQVASQPLAVQELVRRAERLRAAAAAAGPGAGAGPLFPSM